MKTINKEKLKQFLIEDLKKLKEDIKYNKEANIEQFFSYWELHIKDLLN